MKWAQVPMDLFMVPTGTGNQGKLGKWEGIFQSGKSQGILLKILEKLEKIMLEN